MLMTMSVMMKRKDTMAMVLLSLFILFLTRIKIIYPKSLIALRDKWSPPWVSLPSHRLI